MRGPVQRGDSVVISTVAGASPKAYPLAKLEQNVSYKTISEQPEAELNQPLNELLTFHGGLAYSTYDRRTGGCQVNSGILTNEPNVLRAPVKLNTVTLTNAIKPPQYFFETTAPNATIAHDASDSATASSTTVTISNFTVASGNNRILIVGTSSNFVLTSISATFGGVALTTFASHRPSNQSEEPTVIALYLLNPTASTGDIVVTVTPSVDIVVGATSRTDINLLDPFGSVATATATDQTPTVAVTSASGELVIDLLAATNPSSCTVDGSQTQRWNTNVSTSTRGGSSEEAGAASVTMSWALGSSVEWTMLAFALKPARTPVMYAIAPEPNELQVYKVSIDDNNFGTLLNTKTFSVTTTNPMGRPAEWDDDTNGTQWRLPLGDNDKIQRLSSIAASTSNDTWTASGDSDARHFKLVKDQLYKTMNVNEVWVLDQRADPMVEANWSGPNYVGDESYPISDIGESGGISEIAKSDGLYQWDGVGKARRVLMPDDMGIGERNGQGITWWHGGFLIPAGSALWWTRTGTPVSPDAYPENRANHPSISSGQYVKQGRWMGVAGLGAHIYGLYVDSTGTTGKIMWGYESGNADKPITWHCIGSVTADFNDFHGMHITHTSKFTAAETRPCLWFANGNDVSYIWLDKDGAPMWQRGDIDLAASATVISGNMDLGCPRVLKQLRKISGWAEDFSSTNDAHKFQFKAYRDGGTAEDVGTAITASGGVAPDGFFERYWTQDTNDTARSMLIECLWTGAASLTDQDGPLLRDVEIATVAQPKFTRTWVFLFGVKEERARTATALRAELEAYVGDLKQYKLPGNDTFNGTMGDIRALRGDEISELTERNQKPPKYVFAAPVREMPTS